jgi:hypothetical protein
VSFDWFCCVLLIAFFSCFNGFEAKNIINNPPSTISQGPKRKLRKRITLGYLCKQVRQKQNSFGYSSMRTDINLVVGNEPSCMATVIVTVGEKVSDLQFAVKSQLAENLTHCSAPRLKVYQRAQHHNGANGDVVTINGHRYLRLEMRTDIPDTSEFPLIIMGPGAFVKVIDGNEPGINTFIKTGGNMVSDLQLAVKARMANLLARFDAHQLKVYRRAPADGEEAVTIRGIRYIPLANSDIFPDDTTAASPLLIMRPVITFFRVSLALSPHTLN